MLSDHYLTFLVIKKTKTVHDKVTFTCRQLKGLNMNTLDEQLSYIDWDEYYRMEDVNECWTFIYKTMIDILDDLCPERTYVNVNKRSELATSALFELMHKREHLFKKAKLHKDPDLWDEASGPQLSQ